MGAAGKMAFGRAFRAWWQRVHPKRTFGQRGEAAAAKYLKRKGYRIVAHGNRTPWGELDLVAVDGRTVVFVEVKTRQTQDAGHPVEAVDGAKQRQLTRLAVDFLRGHRLLEHPSRFDVVAVTWAEGQRRPMIEHFENAFDAVGQWEFFS
jgi:putative endonuclease